MAKVKLKYKFNNPNTVEDTAYLLLEFLAEINMPKAEKAIKNAIKNSEDNVSHPA